MNTLPTTNKAKYQRACLIDDDEIQTFAMKRMLQKSTASSNFITFSDGDYALKYLKSNQNSNKIPDVIFLDINMPIVDGWMFLEEFEKIENSFSKKIDIYMVSSSIDPSDRSKALSSKLVKDYITKPITLNHFYSIFN